MLLKMWVTKEECETLKDALDIYRIFAGDVGEAVLKNGYGKEIQRKCTLLKNKINEVLKE